MQPDEITIILPCVSFYMKVINSAREKRAGKKDVLLSSAQKWVPLTKHHILITLCRHWTISSITFNSNGNNPLKAIH